jgi:P4 family phage/plasmid primase-like protien
MIWTGVGSNGKGTLINLLDKTMGSYYGTVPPTFLTIKRGSSSQATPELADKFGTRLLTTQEPEGDDKINTGFMKNATGQDKILARPLYGDPFYYVPQFKLLMACNRLPNIPEGGDGGVWRRVRVVDFSQRFVDKPTKPDEQAKDKNLHEKMPTWTQALAWLLLNVYFPIYKKCKDIDEITPAIVFQATDKYQKDTNVYIEFVTDTIIYDDSESMDKSDLWNYFKHWYASSYDGVKLPPPKKFFNYLDNNNFKIKGTTVKGIKLRIQHEEHNNNLDR